MVNNEHKYNTIKVIKQNLFLIPVLFGYRYYRDIKKPRTFVRGFLFGWLGITPTQQVC